MAPVTQARPSGAAAPMGDVLFTFPLFLIVGVADESEVFWHSKSERLAEAFADGLNWDTERAKVVGGVAEVRRAAR